MAEFTVNPRRVDPYASWGFRVLWDGSHVPGIRSISGLGWTTEVVPHREGTDPAHAHLVPGLTSYAPVVLRRGRTHDPAFEQWASLVAATDHPRSLREFRKDITVELLNEQQTIVMAFQLFRCWPSHYSPLGTLDADDGLLALETLTLHYEGFRRDPEIVEPVET